MSELTFSQPERRNFLVPGLIALVVLAAGIGIFALINPYKVPAVAVTHTAVDAEHTVFASDSKLVGSKPTAQDDLYVVANVHIDNRLKIPITVDDITGTITATDDAEATASAIQKSDLANLFVVFPKLVPLAGPPLLREAIIQPGAQLDGMVILHYALAQADWDQRKSASVTIDFYHQDSVTAPIPKT
jgi:hypothetical protein